MSDDLHQTPPMAPIPVAVEYFQADASAVLLKLVRVLGVLLIVIGVIELGYYPLTFLMGGPIFRRNFRPAFGGELYGVFVLVQFLGEVVANVTAIWGGILCLRRPLRGRRVVLVSGYISIGLCLWSTLYLVLVVSRQVTLPFLLTGNVVELAHFVAFPIICVIFFHLRDVRRLFAEQSRN